MATTGGYQVDTNGLAEVAGTAHEQAERVRNYVKQLRALQCPSPDLLGEYGGVDTAYGRFLNSWAEEFKLTADALDEASVKLRESADAYAGTDRAKADDFDRGTRPR